MAQKDAVRPAKGQAPVLTTYPVFCSLWEVSVKETAEITEEGLDRTRIEISAHDKPFKEICPYSLGALHVTDKVRLWIFAFVEHKMFDHFILALICFNTVIMGMQNFRDPCHDNNKRGATIDPILLIVFTLECALKIAAYGLFGNPTKKCPNSYLRDGWNWLDFIVVVTGLMSAAAGTESCNEDSQSSFGFLRVFRAFRPLRSLTKSPKMKVIVNTVLLSIPKLGNVCLMGIFLMTIFGILGINFWGGVMFRVCRDPGAILSLGGDGVNPVLITEDHDAYDEYSRGQGPCWAYPLHEDSAGRVCGGEYKCEASREPGSVGICMSSFPDNTGFSKDSDLEKVWDGNACTDGNPDNEQVCMGKPRDRLAIESSDTEYWQKKLKDWDSEAAEALLKLQEKCAKYTSFSMCIGDDGDPDCLPTAGQRCFAPSFYFPKKSALHPGHVKAGEGTELVDATHLAPYPWTGSHDDPVDMKDGGYPWCDDFYKLPGDQAEDGAEMPAEVQSQRGGWWMIETEDFNFGRTNFNQLPIALLVIFQCITMEGWTDIMYTLQDCHEYWFSCIYFVLLFLLGSLFLLNIALAVVSEAFNSLSDEMNEDDEEDEDDEGAQYEIGEEEEEEEVKAVKPEKLWYNNSVVRLFHKFQDTDVFQNTIMAFIVLNVLVMMVDKYPNHGPSTLGTLYIFNLVFTFIFAIEFFILNVALGPRKYWTGMMTLLDGLIVLVSFLELAMDQQDSAGQMIDLKPLRGFRLLRIFKLAKKWTSFRILVKSMLRTVKCMGHFSVLLVLVMVVFSLMGMTFFGGKFRFADDFEDGHRRSYVWSTVSDTLPTGEPGTRTLYCGLNGEIVGGARDNCDGVPCDVRHLDCVPRAHFDNFLWAFVTCFQVLSGENWNTVMYDGMISIGGAACIYFLLLVVAGQLIILNLFLAILMEEFEKASEETRKEESSGKVKKEEPKASAMDEIDAPVGGLVAAAKEAAKKAAEEEAAKRAAEQLAEEEANAKWPCGYSMFMFHPSGKVRQWAKRINAWTPFDNFILALIIISSLAMVLDNPLQDPGSTTAGVLKVLNYIFTLIFIIEMMLKMIAYGVLFGKEAYWKNSWNRLDGLVVFVATADIIMFLMGIGGKVSFFKTLRVLRALRPLRVISRNPNLKLVVNTLFNSLPDLCNLLTVAGLFFLIFGLLFVNMLKGGFYTCNVPDGGEFGGYDYTASMVPTTTTVFAKDQLSPFPEEDFLSKQACARHCHDQIPRMEMVEDGFNYEDYSCTCAAQTSWMCIDANEDSTSYGALWPVVSGWAADANFSASTTSMGDDCQAYLAHLLTWSGEPSDDGPTLPPPSTDATLKYWHRMTDDTPLCEASCLGAASKGEALGEMPPGCPDPLTVDKMDKNGDVLPGGHGAGLPNVCGGSSVLAPFPDDVLVIPGRKTTFEDDQYASWKMAGTRWLMPCGKTSFVHDGKQDKSGMIDGCRERFKGGDGCSPDQDKVDQCTEQCKEKGGPTDKPFFCTHVCGWEGDDWLNKDACAECEQQCIAQCVCEMHCEPYQLDAGVCLEQGGYWENMHQHFDNIGQAMLTLIEIATTEGWVDVMYMATDYSGQMLTPRRRGASSGYTLAMSIAFVFFMVLGSFFILNLCVGVIVDNFSRMKEDGGDIMLTENQKQWQETKKLCEQHKVLFGVTDLQRLPPRRRQAFFIVRDSRFETGIMVCILLNTLVMGLKQFPAPTANWYGVAVKFLNYLFALVFLCEASTKLFVLRWTYFKDNWNVFDFVCVLASLFGIIADVLLGLSLGPVMSGIRLFRIARLFRLLRFAKGLNKLFNAFLLSIPKLLNVAMILALLLFLFSVMGVAMFASVHYHGPHSPHAHFRTFPAAIMTLLRCMTGEGWNEVMHSMMKTAIDFGRMQEPCVDNLDITEGNYDVLAEKCITGDPLSRHGLTNIYPLKCGSSELGVFFFIAYTCVMTFVILNLFVAVVLEGFDGSSVGDHEAVISKCIEVWQRYDGDLTMRILKRDAVKFISEVNQELQDDISKPMHMSVTVRHKIMSRMEVADVEGVAYVDFKTAVQCALCLNMINVSDNPDMMMKQIDDVDDGSRQAAEKYSVEFVQNIFRERAKRIKAARVTEPDGSPGPAHPSRQGQDGSGSKDVTQEPGNEAAKGSQEPEGKAPKDVPRAENPPPAIPGACDVDESEIPVAG
jgi:hypothetical protein